ncbi:glycine rich domain-containing protein, partial [Segatella albensis]
YVSGFINIEKLTILYVYVGGIGVNETRIGGWNGGGNIVSGSLTPNGNYTGGGSTDIRLQNGNWDNFNSLKSRIIVASGGGGCCVYNDTWSIGGHAGGLVAPITYSRQSSNVYISGATQTSGSESIKNNKGLSGTDGLFGKGGTGGEYGGGGGAGYYGGAGGSNNPVMNGGYGGEIAGAGGSSFISGYPGCNAISSSSTENNIVHTGQPNHYSGKVFTNTVMVAGNVTMPSPTGGTETGHSGHGYCIISWISPSL